MEISEVLQGTTFIPGSGREFYIESLPELPVEIDEEREQELRHALDLREARESLVALYLELPAVCSDHVLEGSLHGTRRNKRWSSRHSPYGDSP